MHGVMHEPHPAPSKSIPQRRLASDAPRLPHRVGQKTREGEAGDQSTVIRGRAEDRLHRGARDPRVRFEGAFSGIGPALLGRSRQIRDTGFQATWKEAAQSRRNRTDRPRCGIRLLDLMGSYRRTFNEEFSSAGPDGRAGVAFPEQGRPEPCPDNKLQRNLWPIPDWVGRVGKGHGRRVTGAIRF